MVSYYLQRGHTLEYLLSLDELGKAWHYASMEIAIRENQSFWESLRKGR